MSIWKLFANSCFLRSDQARQFEKSANFFPHHEPDCANTAKRALNTKSGCMLIRYLLRRELLLLKLVFLLTLLYVLMQLFQMLIQYLNVYSLLQDLQRMMALSSFEPVCPRLIVLRINFSMPISYNANSLIFHSINLDNLLNALFQR